MLIDALDAGDARRGVHLTPEREPGPAVCRTQTFGGQTRLEIGPQPIDRTAGRGHAPAGLFPQTREQLAEGGLQQAILVDEVMRHEPGRDIRLARDVCESRALNPDFCETFEGDFDELLSAGRVTRAGGCAVGGGCRVAQGEVPLEGQTDLRIDFSMPSVLNKNIKNNKL